MPANPFEVAKRIARIARIGRTLAPRPDLDDAVVRIDVCIHSEFISVPVLTVGYETRMCKDCGFTLLIPPLPGDPSPLSPGT